MAKKRTKRFYVEEDEKSLIEAGASLVLPGVSKILDLCIPGKVMEKCLKK